MVSLLSGPGAERRAGQQREARWIREPAAVDQRLNEVYPNENGGATHMQTTAFDAHLPLRSRREIGRYELSFR